MQPRRVRSVLVVVQRRVRGVVLASGAVCLLAAACQPKAPRCLDSPRVSTVEEHPVQSLQDPVRSVDTCASGVSQWLASSPRVPLAVVNEGGIAGARDCCASWRDGATQWLGIDAWGQPTGTATVAHASYYGASECWELRLNPRSSPVPALYVAGSWTAGPSAAWSPTTSERASFDAFITSVRTMTASPEYHAGQYTKRRAPKPAFFQLPPSDDRHNHHPTKFAAMGGSMFVIAYLARNGQWMLGSLLNDTAMPAGPADTYDVVAIVDMDRDGFPEVVVHVDEGPAWNDVVLTLDNPYLRYAWREAAMGVLGGTI